MAPAGVPKREPRRAQERERVREAADFCADLLSGGWQDPQLVGQSSGVFSVLESRIDGEGGACDHRE